MTGTGRTGIVVAQLGGPRDLTEVEPFIRDIFLDPDVVPLPGGALVRKPFAWAVAKARAPFVRRYYRAIGGGSPILRITRAQARLVEEELRRRGHDVVVAVAMRITRPDTRDAVEELVQYGAERLIMLPLYPQYSFATTGSSESELRRQMEELGIELPLDVIRTWCDHGPYLELIAELVTETMEQLPEDRREGVAMVVSAHGLPQRTVARGDPYPEETRRTMDGFLDQVPYEIDARLAYQSRTSPIKWIGPGTDEVIADFGREGHEALVMVPISFVSDHIETLYEGDVLFREKAEKAGIDTYLRVPVFNDRPELGPVLADLVEPRLG